MTARTVAEVAEWLMQCLERTGHELLGEGRHRRVYALSATKVIKVPVGRISTGYYEHNYRLCEKMMIRSMTANFQEVAWSDRPHVAKCIGKISLGIPVVIMDRVEVLQDPDNHANEHMLPEWAYEVCPDGGQVGILPSGEIVAFDYANAD